MLPLLGEGNDEAQVAGQLVCRTQRLEYLGGKKSAVLKTCAGDPWHFGADPDPWIRTLPLTLLLTEPDRDPTPDPTPFFSDFKDAKKLIFSHFFRKAYLQTHYLQF